MSYQQERFKEIADKLREYTDTSALIAPRDFALKIDDVAMIQFQKGKAEGGGETLLDADVMEFPLDDGSIGKVSTDSKYYDDIATLLTNAPGGISDPIKPSEMYEEINKTMFNTYNTGHDNGLIEGEAMGRQAQYDEFWDTYQKNPNQTIPPPKTNYKYMFGGAGWNSKTFNPKYDMIGSSFERTFHSSSIEEINVAVDMSGIASSTGCNQTFYGATALKKISRFVPPPFAMSNAFTNCSSLEEITIVGNITKDFNISDSSKLNSESLTSIVDHLAEVTDKTTLTLHATAKGRLTDAQIVTIDEKGWTLA